MTSTYEAWVARGDTTAVTLTPKIRDVDQLPPGEVTVEVQYSSVNFKDALAVSPGGGVIREYPLVAGIDLTGIVSASTDPDFWIGDPVLAHGYEIGVSRDGGYAQLARVPSEWVVPLDAGLSGTAALTTDEAAAIGTAGFTAAMSVQALERHGIGPDSGPILVTGASGGVGTCAVDILSGAGYEVVASTGKAERADLLRKLGAADVIPRLPTEGRTLGSARWAGAVDCVGGTTGPGDLISTLDAVRAGAHSGRALLRV